MYVCNKNKITQASRAMHHSAELAEILLHEQCSENALINSRKSVLVITCDGGPDHRLSYGAVQISLLALFLRMNLDMLIAVRTCPNQSWTNTAERVMSILNLSLQNVSLERKAMDDDFEKVMARLKHVKAVRSRLESSPEMKQKVNDSLQPVISLLNDRFNRMKLKGRHFKTVEAAGENQIESIFGEVQTIDASVSQNDMTRKALKDADALQKFLDGHCHHSHYAFQLKKCSLNSCSYCSVHPVRMPQNQFEIFNYLPMPRLDASGQHFKPFAEVYGEVPNEADRPSLQNHDGKDKDDIDKQNRKLLSCSGKVRMALQCGECFKSRCVYSNAKLTSVEKNMLCELEEEYTCGDFHLHLLLYYGKLHAHTS